MKSCFEEDQYYEKENIFYLEKIKIKFLHLRY